MRSGPGCYDVHERVKDMNAGGILASMNFPSFPGFAARLFATEDPEFSKALVQAYNDWHIDEWCGGLSGTLHPDGAAGDLGSFRPARPRCGGWRPRAAFR